MSIEAAIERYVKTLFDNKAIIGIATVDGSIRANLNLVGRIPGTSY